MLPEHWLLLDSSISYSGMNKYVQNDAKLHLWARCDGYCTNEHAGPSI